MSKKGVEKRHSETALFAALYRAVSNKEFKSERLGSDNLAEYFLQLKQCHQENRHRLLERQIPR